VALKRAYRIELLQILLMATAAAPLLAQRDTTVIANGDSVRIRLIDVDLRAAVQALSQYLDRPVVFGAVAGNRVTLETPQPVPRLRVVHLLRSLVESQDHELLLDSSGVYRVSARRHVQPGAQQPASRSLAVPELFVIRLRHARASDVAATVSALYGRAAAVGELDAPAGTLGQQLRQNLVAPAGAGPPQLASGAAGRIASLTGDVTIVPDQSTNALLIRASRADFELLQAAVQELDVRPLQVLIEVLIVEMRRDRSFSFGLDLVQEETRTGGTTISGSSRGLGLGDLVINVMRVGGGDLNATLRASAARGDAAILSRPVVLAANNERAVITVGSQRPFIQVARSLPTDAPSRDQVVQYKDVGTSLSVRPTISGNGYVTLEVVQEVNAATSETAFDAPVISTRSVRTQLLVRDGQTVILGGLTDSQREETRGGLPFLSALPIVGGLFGRQAGRSTSTELFLFLTPRILRTDEEADAVTRERRERTRSVEP
jgi:general secretion pathway protein D